MVGRPAVDGCRCGLDDQHHREVRRWPGRGRGGGARAREERQRAERDDARDPLRLAGRQRAGPARDVLRAAEARLAVEGGRRRQGAEDLPPGAPSPDRQRGRVHDLAVREEGDDGVQAVRGLLRPALRRVRGCADVLHELRRGDRRPRGRSARLGRPGAVQGGQRGEEERQGRRDHDPRRRDDQHHVELEPGEDEEPGAPQPGCQAGALDVRRPRPDHRRGLRRLRNQGREPRRAHLRRPRESEPRPADLRLCGCQHGTEPARVQARVERHPDGARNDRCERPGGAPDAVRDPHPDVDRLQRRS